MHQERIHYAASLIQALGRGALCRLRWARTLSHHRLNKFENLAKSEIDYNAAEEFPTIGASHGSATEQFSKTTSNVRQNNNPEIIEHRYPSESSQNLSNNKQVCSVSNTSHQIVYNFQTIVGFQLLLGNFLRSCGRKPQDESQ